MEDKPRYSRISDIIDLAIYMSSKVQGVTLNEIAKRYCVSRKTAMRMKDSLTCIFPSIDEIPSDGVEKYWGFTNYSIANLVTFTPEEIGNIEQQQRRTTNKEAKQALTKAIEKMKAINRKGHRNIEGDVAIYLQTEGYAVRQMPQYKISLEIIDVIREALHYSKMVTGIYHEKDRLIEPLGLIYGEKIYLVAYEKAKGDGIYNYLLHKFENLKLTDKTFDRGDFNLQEYTNQSFGVYHDEILNVELLFSKELAPEASKFNFHPTQELSQHKDGTLTVKFKASGIKEIIWHVFKWGDGCKIVAPAKLRDYYKDYLQRNLNNY